MPLTKLCADWIKAKSVEAAANALRLDIEIQILAITGHKEEGAKTVTQGDYKLSVTGKLTRKMDWVKWEAIKSKIATEMHPVKTTVELDEKGVKYLKLNEPEIYALLPIEIKPAKTSIDIKMKEEAA